MLSNIAKRSIRVATIAAIGGALLAMPVSAFAAAVSTESDGDAKVKIGAGNNERTERYIFDVEGQRNGNNTDGDWQVRVTGATGTPAQVANKNGKAKGDVLCVSGHDLNGKPGNIAVIGVEITESDTNFYEAGEFVLHYVYDSAGVDQTFTKVFADEQACPANFSIEKSEIAGMDFEKIRSGGDLDVKIND